MNQVDAICTECGKPFRWYPVTAMVCPKCRAAAPAAAAVPEKKAA